MDERRQPLQRALELIAAYRDDLPAARVGPISSRDEVTAALAQALPEDPTPPEAVIEELVSRAQPGLMASAGPRYFGFVIGGSIDAALVADLLTVGWDQCGFNAALSPAALAFEDVAGSWLKELLHIPASASVGFVTGGQAANTIGLAAARWQVLHRRGWDVGRDGLDGAPRVRVIAGAERHATVDRALRLLGLGESALEELPATPAGTMDPEALEAALASAPGDPTIVCAQAGNVNTGACDDLKAIGAAART